MALSLTAFNELFQHSAQYGGRGFSGAAEHAVLPRVDPACCDVFGGQLFPQHVHHRGFSSAPLALEAHSHGRVALGDKVGEGKGVAP